MTEKLDLDGYILPKSMAQTTRDMGKKNIFGADSLDRVIALLTTETNNKE